MAYEKLRIAHNQKEESRFRSALFLAGKEDLIEQALPIPNGIDSILIFDFGGDTIQTPEGPKYHNPFLERDLKKIGVEHEYCGMCCVSKSCIPEITKSQLEELLKLNYVKAVCIIPRHQTTDR